MLTTTRAPTLIALVPVKDLGEAKQRLAGILSAEERRRLYRAMLEDVMLALGGARRLGGILVVTRDLWATSLAHRLGAEVLREPSNDGHTAASTRGAVELAARGACGMLQVPGDLPLLTPDDVDRMIELHGAAPAVTIAPSRDRRGSNAVASSPPGLLPLRFGEDSFVPHVMRARALGVTPRTVERAGFAFDVDTPEDLRAILGRVARTRTGHYLETSGIAARLRAPVAGRSTHAIDEDVAAARPGPIERPVSP